MQWKKLLKNRCQQMLLRVLFRQELDAESIDLLITPSRYMGHKDCNTSKLKNKLVPSLRSCTHICSYEHVASDYTLLLIARLINIFNLVCSDRNLIGTHLLGMWSRGFTLRVLSLAELYEKFKYWHTFWHLSRMSCW